jgi:ABC-type thiamin/hydroxymethylpyrimidine transport system permease subunit
MKKKWLASLGLGSAALYYFGKDYITDFTKSSIDYMAEVTDKGIRSLTEELANKIQGISQQAFNYNLEKIKYLNEQLGANIATSMILLIGVPILVSVLVYLMARH